jgi:DNA mismatch repair protein MutL
VVEAKGPAALPPGTRVRVEDCSLACRRGASSCARAQRICRLPRRRKRLAMARPDIAFSVEHDGVASFRSKAARPAPTRRRADRPCARENSVAIDFEREGLRSAASPDCRPSTAASPIINICSSTAAR